MVNNILSMNYDPNKHPCRDCKPPKRCVGCHGTCQEYIDFEKNKPKPPKNYFSPMGKAPVAVLHRKKKR